MIQLLNFVLGVDVQENVRTSLLCRYAKEMEAWELARLQKDDRFNDLIFINLSLLRTAPLKKSSHSGDSNEAGDELPIELRHLEDR